MVIEVGEKLHVIEWRKFETDLRRHFVGKVVAAGEGVLRVEGFPFILDTIKNEFHRLDGTRKRIFPAAGSGFVINVIPDNVDIEFVEYVNEGGRVSVTDQDWTMEINEFSARR